MFHTPWKFFRCKHRRRQRLAQSTTAERSLAKTYQAVSTASADVLWEKIIDLDDVSWHPLLSSTNVPRGLVAKPGLIYEAVTRLSPFPIRIFVERVDPGELLKVRVLAIPGMEERVTYEVKSTLCGTRITYSMTLHGWLSPLIWSIIKPYAARVASDLAQAAEHPEPELRRKSSQQGCFDF
ncbi:SRPBCC family protein [Myxacorys almedinensis]|uniref:SRPBCC family protein n=1 Tax=Myxacorys almedinensis A TaxID=2690445 RepID=A0A8J7Z3I0_9CYAN|nr:SRPBCC family protein [Myxacorys almedinensis]NDJ19737.1 SRPBCC family protein [Myxacorys almedinensis A]